MEWTFVNIFLPALLPVIVLTVLSIFDLGRTANSNAHPFVAVKDGQLAWAGLGMCLNALYEPRHPNEKSIAAQFPPDALFWQLISATLILTSVLGKQRERSQYRRLHRCHRHSSSGDSNSDHIVVALCSQHDF